MASIFVRTTVPALLLASSLGLGAACSGTTTEYPPLQGSGGSTEASTTTTTSSSGAAGGTAGSDAGSEGGACTSCATPSDCAAQPTACKTNECTAGCCAETPAPANTACTDDGGKFCDGSGTCRACNTDSQCPASTTVCAASVCTANACSFTLAKAGTPCTDSGGTLCNATGMCVTASCTDGVQDGNETDVDCGGGTCPRCPDGDTCKVGTDCANAICSGTPLTCQAPSCTDGVQNGDETGVDCGGGSYMGGAACPPCGTDQPCAKNSDCASMVCTAQKCAAPSCSDGVQNGNETDVDCGGSGYMSAAPCPGCAPGQKCANSATNCKSLVCTNDLCQVPTCSDGVKNGDETDIDCGGGSYMGALACPPCNPGEMCTLPTDCVGGDCQTTCQCPLGMLTIPIQGGGIFCVDAVEVTYGAYNTFYSANPTTANQDPWCSWNLGWTPSGAWPYASINFDEPVRYVNWCQAEGYCKYLGRRLCGQIGGGSATQADFADFSKDQWFDACTAQGENCDAAGCYPYGTAYEPMACNGADLGLMPPGPQSYLNLPNCQGGAPNLYEMSGNVAEWEDSCDAKTGNSDECAVRGGSYTDDSDGLRCDSGQTTGPITQARNYQGNDVGFRCCL